MRGIIYGKTLQSAQLKLQHIINDYEFYNIATMEKRLQNQVIFSNGDVWTAYAYNPLNTRGRKCNVVYIDSHIEDEEDKWEMECVACAPPFQAITYYANITDRND